MRTAIALTAAAILMTLVVAVLPARAQTDPLPDLPVAPPGTVGEALLPLTDIVDMLLDPIDETLTDLALDNAVRLTATDAVDAAIALSQATFPTSDIVFVARDDVHADSLSSTAAQGLAGAPLLLTGRDGLDDRTAAEIARLDASRIVILGNDAAVTGRTGRELALAFPDATIDRFGGQTRIETAIEIAEAFAPDATTAVLVRAYGTDGADAAQAYVDALAVGPYASLNEFPILLSESDRLSATTEAYLAESAIETVMLIGGSQALADDIETRLLNVLQIEPGRIAGANRFDTAVQIATNLGYTTAADPSRLVLTEATGGDTDPLWSAGFAAAAHGAVYDAPILLSDGAVLPPETLTFIVSGFVDNLIRTDNEPLVCNSFVDIAACRIAALLMGGHVEGLTGLLGDPSTVIGGLLTQVRDAIDVLLADGTLTAQEQPLFADLADLAGALGVVVEETDSIEPSQTAQALADIVGAGNLPSDPDTMEQVIADLQEVAAGIS